MSDDTIQLTAHYGRKMSDGNYGHVEAAVFWPTTVPADTEPDSADGRAAMTEAMDAARSQVAETLNDRTMHRAVVKQLLFDLWPTEAEDIWQAAVLARVLPAGPPLFLSTHHVAAVVAFGIDQFGDVVYRHIKNEVDSDGY